jgi:hypothetical protein
MTAQHINVQPFAYIREKCTFPGVKGLMVYYGFIDPMSRQATLAQKFQTGKDKTTISARELDFFENNYKGDFTARFLPSGEFCYFSTEDTALGGMPFNAQRKAYAQPGVDMPEMSEILAKAIEREKRITELEAQVQALEEELAQFETHGGKFSYALEAMLERVFPRLMAPAAPGAEPLNGLFNQHNSQPKYNSHKMPEEQLTELENALAILVDNFGEEWLIRFADVIAKEPHQVQKIKTFFP